MKKGDYLEQSVKCAKAARLSVAAQGQQI